MVSESRVRIAVSVFCDELTLTCRLSKIDAAFVTDSEACMHAIAEMTNWTLGGTKYGALQDSVDVYLSEASLESFKKRIPYLVDKKIAKSAYLSTKRASSLTH